MTLLEIMYFLRSLIFVWKLCNGLGSLNFIFILLVWG